jgi:hypothetical protein
MRRPTRVQKSTLSTKLPKPADEPARSNRSPRDAKAWEQLQGRIQELFPLTKDGSSSAALVANLRRIESGFRFVAVLQDSDFSELHVEPLLDQAADLLDRGVRDRATYDDLAAKAMLLSLEIGEFSQLDTIHQQEEAFGIYELPYNVADAELKAEQQLQTHRGYGAAYLQWMGQAYYDASTIAALRDAAQRTAHMAGRAAFKAGSDIPQYLVHEWPVNSGKNKLYSSTHQRLAAKTTITHRLGQESDSLLLQQAAAEAEARAGQERMAGLQARLAWDYANRWFARWRTQVARKTNDIKTQAAAATDGVLNYGKRIAALRDRFQQDFRNALARLHRAQRGLEKIYGYAVPLPADPADIDYFDDCLAWTREAIDWLVRFVRREQSMVLPVSVRRLVGEAKWAAGLANRRWSFSLRRSDFERYAHVRLRGALVTVNGGSIDPATLFRIGVLPPEEGDILHLSGSWNTVPRGNLPWCETARATVRDARRNPDAIGVVAMHNASPIGDWRVTVGRSMLMNQVMDGIEDIVIDLHVSYRTNRD